MGSMTGLDPTGFTTFFMNSLEEKEPMPNEEVVPFSDALAAAKEFFASPVLPPSINWFEL
jgi:hypothetical protein